MAFDHLLYNIAFHGYLRVEFFFLKKKFPVGRNCPGENFLRWELYGWKFAQLAVVQLSSMHKLSNKYKLSSICIKYIILYTIIIYIHIYKLSSICIKYIIIYKYVYNLQVNCSHAKMDKENDAQKLIVVYNLLFVLLVTMQLQRSNRRQRNLIKSNRNQIVF